MIPKRLMPFVFTFICLVSLAGAQDSSLTFFVVDKSGSMDQKNLTNEVKDRLKQFVHTLGERDEVRIVFFSHQASGYKRWESMTRDAKWDFERHVDREMRPRGLTRLFDTVIEVLREVKADAENFRTIRVMILSDGDDSNRGQAQSWDDVHPHASAFKIDNPNSLITLYTLSYVPEDLPDPQWIGTRDVPNIHEEGDLFVEAPTAAFEVFPRTVQVGDEIRVIALPSIGGIETYTWSFGDGSAGEGSTATHVYDEPGTYRIQLAVKGPGGEDNAELVDAVLVSPGPPPLTVGLEWFPANPRVGEPVRFFARSNRPEASIRWRIGAETLEEASPTLSFASSGTVGVSLMATVEGEQTTESGRVQVRPQPPTAAFNVSPSGAVPMGTELRLRAESTEDGWRHTWRLNGVETKEGSEVTWTPNEPGLLEIHHQVQSEGGTATQVDRVLMEAPDAPVATFTVVPAIAVQGLPVVFTANEDRAGVEYIWEIGPQEAGGRSVEFVPDSPGELDVKLTARLGEVQQSYYQVVPVVEGRLVVKDIEATKTSGTLPLEVRFSARLSDGTVAAYQWDFGDGATSGDREPTHVFEKAGNFQVRVSVTNSAGHTTHSPFAKEISVRAPLPRWIWGIPPLVILIVLGWMFRPRAVPAVKVRWEYNGQFGSKELGGFNRDISKIGIPGWNPPRRLTLKNKRGHLWVMRDGLEYKELVPGNSVELEGARCKFEW